jgi:hypothetical protein
MENITRDILACQQLIADLASRVLPERRQRIRDDLSCNGLFVVGHARTGTSILQSTLNTSPDIFILGEANLYLHHNKPYFAQWYRAMHDGLGNPPSKGTSCADPDDVAGDAWDVLLMLRRHYRLVGDKMAFRSRRFGYDMEASYRFLQDYFLGAHIICTLRNPRDVLSSNALLFNLDDLDEYVLSYLECLALQIDLVSTFDHATMLVHERITRDTFVDLGNWLGCDLHDAYGRWYEPHFSEPRHAMAGGLRPDLLELADSYYVRLRRQFESAPCSQPSMVELARIRLDLRADIQRLETQGTLLRASPAQAAD